MQPGRDPVVLGFVDFVSPAHAATAMDALQGVLASALIFNLFAVKHLHFFSPPDRGHYWETMCFNLYIYFGLS